MSGWMCVMFLPSPAALRRRVFSWNVDSLEAPLYEEDVPIQMEGFMNQESTLISWNVGCTCLARVSEQAGLGQATEQAKRTSPKVY